MPQLYNIFDTKAEAEVAQQADFESFKASLPPQPEGYWETTTKWANVQKRADADQWFYPVCPYIEEQTHTQSEATESWFDTISV